MENHAPVGTGSPRSLRCALLGAVATGTSALKAFCLWRASQDSFRRPHSILVARTMPTSQNPSTVSTIPVKRHPEYFFPEGDVTFKVSYHPCSGFLQLTVSFSGGVHHVQGTQTVFFPRIIAFPVVVQLPSNPLPRPAWVIRNKSGSFQRERHHKRCVCTAALGVLQPVSVSI